MGAVGYAGDLSASEAWDMLARDRDAILADVRCQPEWQFVGVPDLGGLDKAPLLVSWQTWPGMAPNDGFLDVLRRAVPARDTPILFLCRSGVRSKAAAMAAASAGFRRSYNVSGGFEGKHDVNRHRGAMDGWKAAGLPWIQE